MNITANQAIAPQRLTSLYDEYGVDFVHATGDQADPITWTPATNPTILDREVDEDGDVIDAGNWDLDEADEIIAAAGFRRTSGWTFIDDGSETVVADIERI